MNSELKTNVELSDEEKVAKLLGSLRKMSAPNDFEFRVNARIAQGRPAVAKSLGMIPALRYTLPLALILMVGAALILNTSYSFTPESVPSIAVANEQAADVASTDPETAGVENMQPPEAAAMTEVGTTPEIRQQPGNVVVQPRTTGREPTVRPINAGTTTSRPISDGGSFDRALRSPSETILPPGIPSNANILVTTETSVQAAISAERVLQQIGINPELRDGKWIAGSVRMNSPADRSGIVAGDVIEAIDGQAISTGTTFGGRVNGKTLKVSRDGREVVIDIRY